MDSAAWSAPKVEWCESVLCKGMMYQAFPLQ